MQLFLQVFHTATSHLILQDKSLFFPLFKNKITVINNVIILNIVIDKIFETKMCIKFKEMMI